MDQILNRQDFDLEGKYGVALETVQRVNPDTFTKDLMMLTSLKRDYEEMKRHVSDFLNPNVQDAIAIKLLEAVAEMRIITVNDCKQVLGEFKEYKKAFESKFSGNIKLLKDYHMNLETSYEQLKQGMELYTRNIQSGFNYVDEYLPVIANDAKMWTSLIWATIEVLEKDMLTTDPSRQNEKYVPAQYFTEDTKKSCKETFRYAPSTMANLLSVYSNIETHTKSNNQRVDLFQSYLDSLNNVMNNNYTIMYEETTQCVQEFSSIVNNIVEWLDRHTLKNVNETSKKDIDQQEKAINQFADNRDNLISDIEIVTTNLNKYSRNQTMKLNYLTAITTAMGGETTTLLSKIDLFTTRAQSETVDPLKARITEAKQELEKWYVEALKLAVDVNGYMDSDYFWHRVGSMDIWKLPSPNLEEATSPYFLREALEFWRIWDPNMPIKEFVEVSLIFHRWVVLTEGVITFRRICDFAKIVISPQK